MRKWKDNASTLLNAVKRAWTESRAWDGTVKGASAAQKEPATAIRAEPTTSAQRHLIMETVQNIPVNLPPPPLIPQLELAPEMAQFKDLVDSCSDVITNTLNAREFVDGYETLMSTLKALKNTASNARETKKYAEAANAVDVSYNALFRQLFNRMYERKRKTLPPTDSRILYMAGIAEWETFFDEFETIDKHVTAEVKGIINNLRLNLNESRVRAERIERRNSGVIDLDELTEEEREVYLSREGSQHPL